MKNSIIEVVQTKIYSMRNTMVMFEYALAELYGVETKHINQAVRNNTDKFPNDFIFELNEDEFEGLRSKFLTAKLSKRRTSPKAFTEQGVSVEIDPVCLKETIKGNKIYHIGNSYLPLAAGHKPIATRSQ